MRGDLLDVFCHGNRSRRVFGQFRVVAQIVDFGIPGGISAAHPADCEDIVLDIVLIIEMLGESGRDSGDDFAGVDVFMVVVDILDGFSVGFEFLLREEFLGDFAEDIEEEAEHDERAYDDTHSDDRDSAAP